MADGSPLCEIVMTVPILIEDAIARPMILCADAPYLGFWFEVIPYYLRHIMFPSEIVYSVTLTDAAQRTVTYSIMIG